MRTKKVRPASESEDQKYPRVFETFRELGSYEARNLTQEEPSCFNMCVSIRKYRITVEEVEEPKAVLIARVRKLWSECDNHHHWSPLKAVAKELGVELSHDDLPKRSY